MHTLDIATRVSDQYHRYLQSTFRFRDRDLRKSFENALRDSPLTKGPLLEGTPVFKLGASLRVLCQQILTQQPDEAFFASLQADRPLYWHQQESIRRVAQGRNVVVATGTGSGKTESFLYPILLNLIQQQRANQLGPGVRAMVLYPMNALANDQRDRLAAPPQQGEKTGGILYELKRRRSNFRFTFGQYIGQTPNERPERDQVIFDGELATRQEMRDTPPNILLTNYSMLEYLLLRPLDSPLFDGPNARTWRYLVLDEAHQYRGAKGIEMGMLIRRLKQRLRDAGHDGRFTCIATSASLSGQDKDRKPVAQFAAELFDEPFDEDDVILGQYQDIIDKSDLCLAPTDYATILDTLPNRETQAARALIEQHLGQPGTALPFTSALSQLAQRDQRATQLRKSVRGLPTEIGELSIQLFPNLPKDVARYQTGVMAELLAQLRDDDGAPLLTGRYHILLKAMESAYVTFAPEKRVTLDRRDPAAKASFEVALCRECGQHYVVGKIEDGKLVEASRDPSDGEFGAQFFRPLEQATANGSSDMAADGDGDDNEEDASTPGTIYELCVTCGAIGRKRVPCSCGKSAIIIRVMHEPNAKDRPDQIARCGACGYNASGHDPVRELQHGTDGPQAVIASSLFQHMPEQRRKLLAFSDGRQEAAFFAWYFEEAYRDLRNRNLILVAMRDLDDAGGGPQSVRRIVRMLSQVFQERRVFEANRDANDLLDEAYRAVWREALTDERRISLEGVGAIRWHWDLPESFQLPESLTGAPWNLSETEARRVINLLLDSLRQAWAVELFPERGVTTNWESLGLRQTPNRVDLDPGKRVKRVARTKSPQNWEGRTNKRVRWLAKLFKRVNPATDDTHAQNEAVQLLRELWDAIADTDRAARNDADKLLAPTTLGGRRINLNWLRARYLRPDDLIYRCDTCGRLQDEPLRGCCAHGRCGGTPQPISVSQLPDDHYRDTYRAQLPAFLRSEEHTAQLNYKRARDFQAEFKEGKIQLLSSSTTFEVGVDLGDLSTVLLRNVPPEAFNYAQRVGRAGRRAGTLGLAVTYCRRSPHDLYHFAQPDRIIRGLSAPPNVLMRNDKIIGRHVTAWALAHFFRTHADRFKSVDGFFQDRLKPTALDDVRAHLIQHADAIKASLHRIVPPNTKTATLLQNNSWIEAVAGPNSRLDNAQSERAGDFINLTKLMDESKANNDFAAAQWAQVRIQTLAGEDTLSFLSKYGVIPKYGFPVDVVALDTSLAANKTNADVELQRDLGLAIAEFAPTAELIANKQLWHSYGLKRVPAREWERREFRRCRDHNTFVQWRVGEPDGQLSCGCDRPTQQYIVPQFGFTTERGVGSKTPTGKPNRLFSTRPYFAGSVGPEPERVELLGQDKRLLVSIGRASPGRMTMLCEGSKGKAFYICPQCGYGDLKAPISHKTPYGKNCDGQLERVALGHEFDTDVLRLDFPDLQPHADDIWLQLGVAYALASGAAEALEVPATDLSATVFPRQNMPPQILLYDNVPGGAGLVARLEVREIFEQAVRLAAQKVSGACGCGEEESCYGCLRSYNNQFAHRKLKRGPVFHFLKTIQEGSHSDSALPLVLAK